jgi:hypothetical protein
MKNKIVVLLSFFSVFGLFFSFQFLNTVGAHHNDYPLTGPMSGPMTSPLTCPVTGPITHPMTSGSLYAIRGKVTDHLLGFIHNGVDRFFPEIGVQLTAVDIFSHHRASTVTDALGNYTIDPGQAGTYKISISGGKSSFYVPPIQIISDQRPIGVKHVDFEGLIFKF